MNRTCEICDSPEECLAGKYPCSLCGEFIAPVPAEVANKLLLEHEILNRFSNQTRLELFFNERIYCDDNEKEEWRVAKRGGSINDQEWNIVGRGSTVLEALKDVFRAR